MNLAQLNAFFAEHQQPAYRLAQAKRAFYVEGLRSWDELTTLPKALREEAKIAVPWDCLSVVRSQTSSAGDTVKTLFRCADGKTIEAVLMRHDDGRNTVCISCQVGCPMGCAFCATGTMGLVRNLTADEIVEQVVHVMRDLKAMNGHVTNVVFMGMGEPLNNYAEVMRAVRLLNDHEGINLGARHITISTCGIVPGILKLADEPFQVNLAISLHSARNETRSKIMPVNKAYPIEALMRAVQTYATKTNRKVFFEYLLLKGVNDSREEAEALADLLSDNYRLFHVNLIKYHDTEAFSATERDGRFHFMNWLKSRGVPVTHRITFGEDIDAACGQLAVKEAGSDTVQGKVAAREHRQTRSATKHL